MILTRSVKRVTEDGMWNKKTLLGIDLDALEYFATDFKIRTKPAPVVHVTTPPVAELRDNWGRHVT